MKKVKKVKKGSEFSKEDHQILNPVQTELHTNRSEHGITPTVQTIFSKITVEHIINFITDLKSQAILSWLKKKKINPEKTLIIGTYLTGAKIANHLIKSSHVTVVDIYPHLKTFLDPNICFKTSIYELDTPETFDVVIDTTGLGGLSSDEIEQINKSFAFLVENPTSDGSDSLIRNLDQTLERLRYLDSVYSGYLFTGGLNSKTSGTMTLTMDVLRHSMGDVLKNEGVLYAISSLDFYERILFKEKDNENFLKSIKRPAMVISSLKPIDCDQIIQNNLNKIRSSIQTGPI